MTNEQMAPEKFRQLVNKAHQDGAIGLLIWKSPEEREKWGGNEEEMWVTDAFEPHGYDKDGEIYGEYKNMELTRAIQNAFEYKYQFTLATVDGKGLAAMAFLIDKMLPKEGYWMFTFRSIFYKHLSGPIVLIPSYQVIK